MTTPRSQQDIAEDAARAARQAAEEASTPEARFFLRQHADLLARIAASRRRIMTSKGTRTAALLLPFADALPG